jgi:diguanylate cyclase (GGDEF)-like protein/PAS domain S-box-containing protein
MIPLSTTDNDKLIKIAFEKAPLPALLIDPANKIIIKANQAANKLYGINIEGKNVRHINYYNDKEYSHLREKLFNKKIAVFQTKHITQNKKIIDVECHVNVISYQGKKIFYSLIRDITEELVRKEKLISDASVDELTGIPNRRFFISMLQTYLENLKRYQEKFSLIYFDIDNFKYYNDQYGHTFGDQILRNTVTSIVKEKRASDFLARLSGDEFVLILNRVLNQNDLATICKNLNQVIQKNSKKVSPPVTVSIGGYLVSKFESYESIIAKIDRAMYTSKRRGGNSFHITSSTSDKNVSDLLFLLEGINREHSKKFNVRYQPIMDIKNNKVHKVEALLCTNNKALNNFTVEDIIRDAIKHHLISNVTFFVLNKVCQDYVDYIKNIKPDLMLGINITLHELIYDFPILLNNLKSALKKFAIPYKQIVLEINEFSLGSIDNKDLNLAYVSINQLKKLGFMIAIDDFGSGYSNLPYVQEIDVDYLKIDKDYLDKISSNNKKSMKIFEAIYNLSHTLKINVISEGIENKKQLDYVKAIGVEFGQGFYFSEPLLIKKFLGYLKSKKKI